MIRKRLPPDDPREWISRAKSHLALARNVIPDADLEDLCFEAQQGAEKGVKAVFIKRGERFPFSHDLEKLLRLLERNGLGVPKYVNEAQELTQYAHLTRYPGLAGPVTQRQYRRAVRIAAAVLRWAERHVQRP
jgi:HEPN domain-containing protein